MTAATASFTDLFIEAQRQTLESLKQVQDLTMRAATPMLAPDPAKALKELPTPKEVVTAGFDFAAEVLELQKTYALRLAETLQEAAHTEAK